MALIIEDGTIVADANSYVTVAEARSYCSSRGLTIPENDTELEALIVSGFDYLESLLFKGNVIEPHQPSKWPREEVYVNGEELDSSVIPTDLKNANARLSFEATLTDLLPTGSGPEVVREKVDVVEVQYAESGSSSVAPNFRAVDALLQDLLDPNANSIGRTLRI